MCGIAGVVRIRGEGAREDQLHAMIHRVHHRGPDERGVYSSGPVGLAHARLSIIDLSTGQQPMSLDSGDVSIAYNGEIFNYIELRKKLMDAGCTFRTQSDTEVVLRMYQVYGPECVEAFNGQWAFAIWDGEKKRLFMSRDRTGIRPLFYTWAGGDFFFASEIKSLLAHPAVRAEVDIEALDDILTFWITPPPRTFFKDICELPPGHWMSVDIHGDCKQGAYWQLSYPDGEDLLRSDPQEEARLDELRALLTDAVRLRLRADVPVAAYLSGGLDSSLTVALTRQVSNAKLKTFSVTFAQDDYDESAYQNQVNSYLKTEHASVGCSGPEIGRIFPKVVWHAEKPVIRTAPAPLCLLSALVRDNGIKVVVTGEGADEVFGGYDIFKEAKIRRFWAKDPASKFRPLLLKRLYPYMPALQAQSTEYLKAFFHVRDRDLGDPFFSHLPRWRLTSMLKSLLSRDVKEALSDRQAEEQLMSQLPEAFSRWHPLCQAQYLESRYLLPGYILSSQGDRMAAANSVEGRFPFLDHRVVEFASTLHPSLKMRVLCEKYLLKQLAQGLVPEEVIARKKQPYRAPDVPSFFSAAGQASQLPYIAETLDKKRIVEAGLFEPKAVASLVKKCESGRATSVKDSMALVGLLSTQLAVEQFIRGRGEPTNHAGD